MTNPERSDLRIEEELPASEGGAQMNRRLTQVAEVGAALFFILLGGVVLSETRKIPPGVFEPLGAAPVPQAVASVVIVLATGMLVERWWRGPSDTASSETVRPRLALAGGFCIVTLHYTIILTTGIISYALATAGFVVVACLLLQGYRPMRLAIALTLGLAAGFGLQLLFTQLFVVDLPTG